MAKISPKIVRLLSSKKENYISGFYFRNFRDNSIALYEDFIIREKINNLKTIATDLITDIHINRVLSNINVVLYVNDPSLFLIKPTSSDDLKKLEKYLSKKFSEKSRIEKKINLSIKEFKSREPHPVLIAKAISVPLKKKIPHVSTVRNIMSTAMSSGSITGIVILIGGRILGTTIKRSEKFQRGKVPLNTFEANVLHHVEHVKTPDGIVGVQVYICFKRRLSL